MASRDDVDDDDFSELYKEYTGPLVSKANNVENRNMTNKRSHAGSDEEQEERDPNAVPTDFTSREAKVWEAKSKATERNWKKRKEEELICKICGESGHFTQGCPSTLGANRKSQDFFERVPAREGHVKALFTEKVVSDIENDTGCKIKIEEKFIIVSGKDRLILRKGVDAVHKVKEEGDKKGTSNSVMSKSRSPERKSSAHSRSLHLESQRSNPSPCNPTQFQHRYARTEKVVEDRVREDLQKLSRGSPQARAYGNDGPRGRSSLSRSPMHSSYSGNSFGEAYGNGARVHSSHSRSPAHLSYIGNSYNTFDGHSHGRGNYRPEGWNADRRGPEMQAMRKFEYNAFPKSLEDLELEYNREAMDLGRIRDKEEDEENRNHREAIREIRENYMKRLGVLRETQSKQWEELLQLDAQKSQHQGRQYMSASGIGGYNQPNYSEFGSSTSNSHYSGTNFQMEPRGRYANSMENHPSSRSLETYGDLQRQRREEFEKTYNRY